MKLKRIGQIVLGFLFFGLLLILISYAISRNSRLTVLAARSLVADTDHGAIEYRIVGETGPWVLYLHGTPGGYDAPVSPIPGMRTLIPSRPGYLKTALDVGRSPEEQAEAFKSLLDVLEIDRAVVFGTSGGGPAAITFAARYPERTSGLITYAAASQLRDIPDDLQPPFFLKSDFVSWLLYSGLKKLGGPEATVKVIVSDPANQQLILDDSENRESLERLVWSIWPFSQREAGWRNDNHYFAIMDLPAEEIRVPTLILHGTEDFNVPFEFSAQLNEQIHGSVLHAVPNADHMMMLYKREELSAVIREFLDSLNLD